MKRITALVPATVLYVLWLCSFVIAEPATVLFKDCFSGHDDQKMTVSTVYAQVFNNEGPNRHLNLTLIGDTKQEVVGKGDNLATLFTNTELLTLGIWNNRSYFCDTLRPASPLPTLEGEAADYCPIGPGPFAFSVQIPLSNSHELTTLSTRLRAVDPSTAEILCVDVYTTPLKPGVYGETYGHAIIIFWASVALAIAYWLVVGIARIVGAWDRGTGHPGAGIWSRVESGGYVLASALSGERFAVSPALMRFCTPSLRDIFFHTQWCAAVAMVAVQWPRFVYPLLSQTAWATLSYNITLTQGNNPWHWDPLRVDDPYSPPAEFADQMNDPSSVLYVDPNLPNTLFMFPRGTKNGIPAFAVSVGLRPQDLFGVCLSIFLALVAAAVVLSALIQVIDFIPAILSRERRSPSGVGSRSPGPRYSSGSKDVLEMGGEHGVAEEDRSHSSHFLFRSRAVPLGKKSWKRRFFRSGINSFHGSVLHGNLVRLLILFHLPITIFSCYQMTLGRGHASTASIVLAALSFAILSVLIPFLLVVRLVNTTTNKLYDETSTLLALGPLYNHYRHGSQLFACTFFATNVAHGLTIGCGQKSGTAQAIIILIIEVAAALGTSVWLPWGQGASMGLISFFFCVGRIVIAVLLVILTPVVSIGDGAAGWVTYAILFILALVYLAFIIMLLVKLLEALVRIVGGVGFDRSRHVIDSGLLGACGMLGCCGGRRPRRRSRDPRRSRPSQGNWVAERDDSFVLPSSIAKRPSPPIDGSPSGPPSVLRPEHALQPYREESDDEGGHIMRAWHPFPHPGYTPVSTPPAPPAVPASGFARVGGGRAHYDTPYSIKDSGGSSLAFPSADMLPPPRRDSDSPPPTASLTNVARHAMPILPPGAMAPHTRKRSQTAIVENLDLAAAREALAGHGGDTGPSRRRSLDDDDEDDWSDSTSQPRKKWFGLRKARRPSESTRPRSAETPASPPAAAEGGRSFVVVRKGAQGSAPSGEENAATRPSFTVLRGRPSADQGLS